MLQDCFTCILQLENVEVLLFQNDLSLATAFEGDDIPSFGVFTDHQVLICFLCYSSVILFCYDFQPKVGSSCYNIFSAGGTGEDLVEYQHVGTRRFHSKFHHSRKQGSDLHHFQVAFLLPWLEHNIVPFTLNMYQPQTKKSPIWKSVVVRVLSFSICHWQDLPREGFVEDF